MIILYHGASKQTATKALVEGLIPQPCVEFEFPTLFLAWSPQEASKYGEVILKVELPESELAYMRETVEGVMATTYPIEPERIAVYEQKLLPTGTCYPDAWRFLMQQGEGYLIQGSVQLSPEGARVNHAWVETAYGWVWEPQTGQYFTVEDFKVFAPIEDARYNAEEAAIMVARVGKHGPWSTEERREYLGR